MKQFDVVALGEFLIDFTQNGESEQGNLLFEANPGGAPCNVLAMLQKLNRKTAFIGKVGRDGFGDRLRKTALEVGINTDSLLTDPEAHTTLAVVHTFPNGDRDFSFYRSPGADMMLREDELPEARLRDCKIFHFGTLSMTHPGVRAATVKAVRLAKEAGALISFDPNLRPPLWNTLDDARAQIEWGLGQCDILKISDNEVEFLVPNAAPVICRQSGASAYEHLAGAKTLLAKYPNIRMLNLTCGADGSYSLFPACHPERSEAESKDLNKTAERDASPRAPQNDMFGSVFVPSFQLGGTIETTGAGDTFCACVLHDVLLHGVCDRTPDSLKEMLRFANAAAYLVTTKKGAIRSMPDPAEIERILANH